MRTASRSAQTQCSRADATSWRQVCKEAFNGYQSIVKRTLRDYSQRQAGLAAGMAGNAYALHVLFPTTAVTTC